MLQDRLLRPDMCTLGEKVLLRANHFQISRIPNVAIFQYDVSITRKGREESSSEPTKVEGDLKKAQLPLWLRMELFQQQAVKDRLGEGIKSFVFDCKFPSIISLTIH